MLNHFPKTRKITILHYWFHSHLLDEFAPFELLYDSDTQGVLWQFFDFDAETLWNRKILNFENVISTNFYAKYAFCGLRIINKILLDLTRYSICDKWGASGEKVDRIF